MFRNKYVSANIYKYKHGCIEGFKKGKVNFLVYYKLHKNMNDTIIQEEQIKMESILKIKIN